jgi:lysophospholipase L1-like esterase
MNWFQNIIDTFRMIRSSMSDSPNAWEWSIARFETADRVQKPPDGVVVFTGSSSITLWNTLEHDMAPLPVINRGFGGSKIHQVTRYIERIVIPYHPRAVVLFAGTNDIAGANPKTAQEVFEDYRTFVQSVHAILPEIPIYYIGITPSPSRWNLWTIVSEANHLIKTFADQDQRLHFIDLTDHLFTPQGIPDRSLYRFDRLHPNQKGYERWTAVIKPILHKELLL